LRGPEMNTPSELFLSILLISSFLFLLAPAILFLFTGWISRRDEIVAGFSDEGIDLYFKQFHPDHQIPSEHLEKAKPLFIEYYNEQFGRRHFMPPLIILAIISGVLLVWVGISVSSWLETGNLIEVSSGRLPLLCVTAVAGALMYGLTDQIRRSRALDLAPSDLYWVAFRLIVAIPTGGALSYLMNPQVAVPVAFLIGTFPTNALLTLLRRMAWKQLDPKHPTDTSESELQQLQGIDLRKAETFTDEGITTVLQRKRPANRIYQN
jgi:hypothetical protein